MERMTGVSLIRRDRDLDAPFLLTVKKPGGKWSDIQVIRLFRLLPKKRLVALAKYDGRLLLVKIFLGKHASRHSRRERLGVTHITNAGVTTPKFFWQGEVADKGIILAFEYLCDAISLDMEFQKSKSKSLHIVSEIMEVMAQLHNHGVIQTDIHLENFLLSRGACYTIDGGGIKKYSNHSLSERMSLKNLSLFFAQLTSEFDICIPVALCSYEEVRGWSYHHRRLHNLLREIRSSREARQRSLIGKTLRDCSRFKVNSTLTRFMVCERKDFNYEIGQVLGDIDRFVDSGFILKQGNTATVSLVKLSDRSLVIKRYNVKGFFHALKLAFCVSRARISWKNAFRLEAIGIPALKAIALIENRLGFFGSKSYLIAEHIEGSSLGECLRDALRIDNLIESAALKDIFSKLSEAQLSHGDFKASNFLISGQKPILIDLDSMREYSSKTNFRQAFRRDLERFMENWKAQPAIKTELATLLSDLIEEFGVSVK